MFSSGPSYPKLKTNLRLAINRLKLMEKKKSELAQKARKEIADYISIGKSERAKIRVEHIIREDYLVEAMEVTEMYCDLLLARFGLIQQMKDLDEGMAEPISSLIWVAPRLQTDIAELKVIGDQLALKYGKPYAQACREQAVATISEKLIHKLSVQAPPKVMVEKYLIEIAKNYNIDYEPDPQILREAEWAENPLINFEDKNNLGGGSGGASGGGGGGGASGGGGGYNIPLGFHDGPQPFNYPDVSSLHVTPASIDSPNSIQAPTQPFVLPLAPSQPIVSPLSPYPTQTLKEIDNPSFVPSIFFTNPQSLNNCFDEFLSVTQRRDVDILAVSETWFTGKQQDDRFNVEGYGKFQRNRNEGRGGGVAMYVKAHLKSFEPQIKVLPDLEVLWICIGKSLYVCTLYHPPKNDSKPLMDHLVNTVLDLRSRMDGTKFILIGDFNHLPHERLYASLGLRNLVQEPTHKNSTIDLILTDVHQLYDRPQVLPPIGASTHHCILAEPVKQGWNIA